MSTLKQLCLAVGLSLAVTAHAVANADPGPLQLESLDGKPFGVGHTPNGAILAFWRADCAPCLIELRAARDYAVAARPLRFLFVGLEGGPDLAAAARKAGAPPEMLLQGIGSAPAILTAYGGAPPRLPLAVAFTPSGAPCAHHGGLLGTDRVRAWARDCEAVRAGR
ncbi:MAG: thioredoxin-family protein [Caulobacteraceae bacterium]|nr:thioredoxin-family protein [Caulobacteraceae bacterium]